MIEIDEFSFVKEYKQTSFYENLVYFCGKEDGLHIEFLLPSEILVFCNIVRFKIACLNKKSPNRIVNQYLEIKYNFKVNFFTQAV